MNKILIVHDNWDIQGVAAFFRERGYLATPIDTLDRALEVLRDRRDWDVCFLHSDFEGNRESTPGSPVFEVRERLPDHTRVVMMSGMFPQEFDQALHLRADAYIPTGSHLGGIVYLRLIEKGRDASRAGAAGEKRRNAQWRSSNARKI